MGHERPHPIHLLLERENGNTQHRANVDNALRQVSIANRGWLEKMKPRIVGKDITDACSVGGTSRIRLSLGRRLFCYSDRFDKETRNA